MDDSVRDDVMSGAFRCNAFQDDRQWLDCYYAAAQPMRARLNLSPAVVRQPVPGVAGGAYVPPEREFGLAAPEPAQDVEKITSRLKSYTFDKHGIFTVTLENGETWQQLDGDTTVAHWTKAVAASAVEIERGWLGSYNMQITNTAGLFKVRRLK